MTTKLKLSLTERIILANQLRILEAVDPDEAKFYQHQRDALERGYELEYAELATAFSDDGLSDAECNEVYQILEMHRALHFGQRELPADAGISATDVKFRGFDGNNETKYMAYVRFIRTEDKYDEMGDANGFNSHMPMLGRYRRMLRVYSEIKEQQRRTSEDLSRDNLTVEEIRQILAAAAPQRAETR